MQIEAREVGRKLELRVGGQDESAVVVLVPPVDGATGTRLWSFYARILFLQTPDPQIEADATTMTRQALGAWAPEDAPEDERQRADAQWELVNSLRWEEGEAVCQAALYWNLQGGGMDAVRTFLTEGEAGGAPKAQELLLKRNNLWGVVSQLRTSPSGASESRTPELDASPATDTPPVT